MQSKTNLNYKHCKYTIHINEHINVQEIFLALRKTTRKYKSEIPSGGNLWKMSNRSSRVSEKFRQARDDFKWKYYAIFLFVRK